MIWITRAAVLALMLMPASLAAQDVDRWTGLYQAIDHVDGSIDHLSIVASGDGNFTLRGTVSNHGTCAQKTGKPTAGWYMASGTIKDGKLTREKTVVTCEGLKDTIQVPDTALTHDTTTNTLSMPVMNGEKTLVFHRID